MTDRTFIIIDVQSDENRAEIIACIRDTFQFMPGWEFGENVYHAVDTKQRFYSFNLTTRYFGRWRSNFSLADTMDEDETVINDIADISRLLEFIYLNTPALGEVHTVHSINISKAMIDYMKHVQEKNKHLHGKWDFDAMENPFKLDMSSPMPHPPTMECLINPYTKKDEWDYYPWTSNSPHQI